jgi:drug/metabolite transporter (DMT)-like permease
MLSLQLQLRSTAACSSNARVNEEDYPPMSRKSALNFALIGFLWGIPYLFIKVAVDEENGYAPAIVVFGRVLIGALILIPLAFRDRSIFAALRGIKYVAFYAVLEMIIPWILIGTAEQKISSGLAGLLIASVPIWSNLITYFQGDKEALKTNRLLGIGIGFVGVVLIVGIESLTGSSDPLSIVMVIVAAIGYAYAIIMSQALQLTELRWLLPPSSISPLRSFCGLITQSQPMRLTPLSPLESSRPVSHLPSSSHLLQISAQHVHPLLPIGIQRLQLS